MELIKIISFGYKHGPVPDDAIIVDLRKRIRNPYRLPGIKNKTGLDPEVQEIVRNCGGWAKIKEQFVINNLGYWIYRLKKDKISPKEMGIHHFAFGCTGGKHRSVAVVELLAKELESQMYLKEYYESTFIRGVDFEVVHRDLEK